QPLTTSAAPHFAASRLRVKKTLPACLTRRREDAKKHKDSTPQTQTPLLTLQLTGQPLTTSAAPHFVASRLRVKKTLRWPHAKTRKIAKIQLHKLKLHYSRCH
ncbi:MAG: hypothetical protein LW816_14625, partial [Planctomyces sp.]|nr:hypothetical protein [Planctomyces sp.]